MRDVAKDLSVQSFCYRGFKTNAEVAELVRKCGLSKIELSGVHLDFADRAAGAEALKIYKDAGVDITSIAVVGCADNEATERPAFEFARLAGATVIGVDFAPGRVPEAFRTAEKLAEQYDVRLAIHNHGGRHWLGGGQMLETVFAKTNDRIGLCMDTAWALDAGEDPVAMARRFGDRLYAIHLKDFVFDRARKPEYVVVGTGNLDLGAFFGVLEETGFEGPIVLEYEGDVDNPVPALRECVEAVRREWTND